MIKSLIFFIVSLLLSSAAQAKEADWENISREVLGVRTALVEPDQGKLIYLGTENGVYKSDDAGGEYGCVLIPRGRKSRVNLLLFEPQREAGVYAATCAGLYYSRNQGRSWKRIFKGASDAERDCTALAVSGDCLYLGTRSGLFVGDNRGRTWRKLRGKLGDSEVSAIAVSEQNFLYVSTSKGAFLSKDMAETWERIFVPSEIPEDQSSDQSGGYEEGEETFELRHIIAGDRKETGVFLATSSGVYLSRNSGLDWERLSAYGMLSQGVNYLLRGTDSMLYAATGSGIFKYENNRWHELSSGLAAQEFFSLIVDKNGNLYAATNNGLFKAVRNDELIPKGLDFINFYSEGEPDIKKVQDMAIKYAEVEPEKIKEWRKKAEMKAILPKLTVGLDRSERTNYEIYTSATAKYVYEGPYDKSNGWDVALSWELGDLIWNNDQTSIDARSRLMVQLRDDILDQVTKTYFERLRVKMELNNLSIEERNKRMQKQLKLRELTASLDALTGGYFSREIE